MSCFLSIPYTHTHMRELLYVTKPGVNTKTKSTAHLVMQNDAFMQRGRSPMLLIDTYQLLHFVEKKLHSNKDLEIVLPDCDY